MANAKRWGIYRCRRSIRFLSRTAPGILVLLGMAAGALAQGPPYSGRAADGRDRGDRREQDFRFSSPEAFVGFRVGRFFPSAQGEFFDFVTDELTLERNDFRAWSAALEGGWSLNNRADLVFGLEAVHRTKRSEFREWVDGQGLPITQDTIYSQYPLTAGVKILLVPRGRHVGSYAWLPSEVVPFVAGGVGVLRYKLEQSGDFVDQVTYYIGPARLESSGWTPTAYLGGGVDILVARGTYLALDARYWWAEAELERDFVNFDPLDLSGFRLSAGLQFRF